MSIRTYTCSTRRCAAALPTSRRCSPIATPCAIGWPPSTAAPAPPCWHAAGLFAGYQRIRIEGQRESVRITAVRLGVDPLTDPRPAVAVAAGAGMLLAALQSWAAGPDPMGLPGLVEEFFDTLVTLTAESRHEESPSCLPDR
jgi:hypothetical protein